MVFLESVLGHLFEKNHTLTLSSTLSLPQNISYDTVVSTITALLNDNEV